MDEIICYCGKVSKSTIETAILKGAKSIKDIQEVTGACVGSQCKEVNPLGRCCSTEILNMLKGDNDRMSGKCSCCG